MRRYCASFIVVLYLANLNLSWCRRVHLLETVARELGVSGKTDIDYEDGFVVQTILDGNKINTSIYSTFPVPGEDFLYALDMQASQVLKIKLPINHDTVIGHVAGSEDGEAGHRDGWGKYSMFNHPKDLAVDDDGNVYVADVRDCVIRKIDHQVVCFSVGFEGLFFVIGITMVISTVAVLTFKNVNLRGRLIRLQLCDRLMWRRGGDLYTPLQTGALPQLANGMQPPLQTSSLPASLGRQPNLIDFSIDTPAANRTHHAAYVLDGDNSCIGPDDAAAYSPCVGGAIAYTQSAPAALDYNEDDLEDDQRLIRNSETRGRGEEQ